MRGGDYANLPHSLPALSFHWNPGYSQILEPKVLGGSLLIGFLDSHFNFIQGLANVPFSGYHSFVKNHKRFKN